MTAEAGLQPSRNLAGTKTKMKLVDRRPETAKHHLNPSPKRPNTLRNRKQKTLETLPTEPKKKEKKEKIAASITNLQAAGKTCPKTTTVAQPSRNKNKNEARRQATRNS